MDDYSVIVKPLVTEQGMHFANVKSAYSFQVNKRANKTQIKNGVERIYGVKVEKVRTANRKGKPRRYRYKTGKTRHWKRAIVKLHDEDRIDFY